METLSDWELDWSEAGSVVKIDASGRDASRERYAEQSESDRTVWRASLGVVVVPGEPPPPPCVVSASRSASFGARRSRRGFEELIMLITLILDLVVLQSFCWARAPFGGNLMYI